MSHLSHLITVACSLCDVNMNINFQSNDLPMQVKIGDKLKGSVDIWDDLA